MKYIIAIDQGTTSCRTLLINTNGKVVGVSQKEFTQYFPKAGWVEHDPEEIWTTQLETFTELLSNQNISPSEIIGIGITNQRETTVVWDRKTGQAIHNAIVWQDRRTAPFCEKLKTDGHAEYIQNNTGLIIDAYFSGTKVKWILDNVDGAREKANSGDLCFGTIDSWLIYKMSQGESHVTDHTNASRTLLYNIKSKTWDTKMLDLLDVPATVLPNVQNSASHFGVFRYEGYEIPICGVAGDQQAALFGQACFDKGSAKNTYGTGCFLLMNIGDDYVKSQSGLLTTLCCNELGEPSYALEGSIFIAGAAIQWLRDGLKIISDSAQTQSMAEEVKDDHDVVVVPAFAGLGAPYWNMYARGAIFGLTRGTSQNHIAKATLDSLAYQTKDVLDAMIKDSNVVLNVLKVDGGATQNNYLMQFQSDILNCAVERPENVESTAMGAAYLAGITLGIWTDEVIEQNRNVEKSFEPNIEESKIDMLYTQWQKAVRKTMDWIDN